MTARRQADIGLVGVGNLGSALARGWLRCSERGLPTPGLLVYDADRRRADDLAAESEGHVEIAGSAEDVATRSDVVVLAVKPQDLGALVHQLSEAFDEQTVVISTAAGVGLGSLRAGLGPRPHVVRIMPNLAVAEGLGVVALAPEEETPVGVVERVTGLLEPLGLVEVLPERYFDAVTAVTGSGPGFLALVSEGLEDGAVYAGLPRTVARRFVRRALVGTAALLERDGASAAGLKDAVSSPGGTTVAGLAVLEERAVRGALMHAIAAAARRGLELSGGLS